MTVVLPRKRKMIASSWREGDRFLIQPIVTKVPSAWTMLQVNEIVLIDRSFFQCFNDVGR